MKKRTHPPVDIVKRCESFESTWLWQIKEFLCHHMLILSNIRGHSKLSSTNIEQLTMFWNIGEHRDQKWPRSLWAAARILLSHSLLQRGNIHAFCLKEAVSHKTTIKETLMLQGCVCYISKSEKMFFKFERSLLNFWWCAVDLWVDCWGPSLKKA